ncbi:MAG: single-stranded DNA-binding protein [Chloroflexi bacterium]|nr:MAG: single-stranded DNA-binding protein [Chloroflexota bacterium]
MVCRQEGTTKMLNKIMLIGNLGRDPEMTYTSSGKAVTKFSLAVSRRMKDPDTGDNREETTWFTVIAWERLAETCSQYLHKGSKAYIEGRMTSRKYTNKDGIEVTAWEVVASNLELLDPKSAASSGTSDDEMTADQVPF